MTQETFTNAINAIQKQQKRNARFAKHMGKAFPNAFEANLLPDNRILENALLEVLKEATGDKANWIEYFCHELDFGKEWTEGSIRDEDGQMVRMQTAGELWDFLQWDKG